MARLRDITLLVAGAWLAYAACGCGENQTHPSSVDGGTPSVDCLPDLDGVIEAHELPVALELSVEFFVSASGSNPSVDVAGTVAGGQRLWDMKGEDASDETIAFQAAHLSGAWYASSFPGGHFALATERDGAIDAIYRKDDTGLWLLGLASHDESPAGGQTLLPYGNPVALFRFPMAPGDSFTESGTIVGGTLDGLPYNGTDTYEVEVDGAGRLDLPYVSFTQAMRVRTRVVVAPAAGGVTTSRRQVSFIFECFGEVARVTSRPEEANRDFTTAAELRRFAL